MERNNQNINGGDLMRKVVPVFFILLLISTPVFADTGRDIMELVIENQKADSSAMDIRMSLIDSRGNESTRRVQMLTLNEDGLTKTITLFLEPANIKNTRFLTVENTDRADDQWIYLPSLRKVRRIAAAERDGSFMGSDFYYSDMSAGDIDDSEYIVAGEEKLAGKNCWVVEAVPDAGSDSSYGRIVSWVDQETYLTMKVEFYDEDGRTLLKELTMEGPRQIDGRWSAEKTIMLTIESDHRTVLEMRQVKYDIPINPGYFTTNFLQTGRP